MKTSSLVSIFVFVSLVLFLSVFGRPGPSRAGQYVLPDTGQTKCYDGSGAEITCPGSGERFYGQDGNYQRAQPAFTDNGNGTVTDLNTGLMWQKDDDHNTSGRSWNDAVSYCEALDLGGYTDWRLPAMNELESIVNYGTYSPAIDKRYFTRCYSGYYRSSTSPATNPDYAWGVYFDDGTADWINKANSYYVRCARGGT